MATERLAVRQAVLNSTAPPYFIVKFTEDSQLCAVPVKEIVEPSPITLKEGSECIARYAGIRYEAVVVSTAKSFVEAKKLEAILRRQQNSPSPPAPAPKKKKTPSKPTKQKVTKKIDEFTLDVGTPPPQLISPSNSIESGSDSDSEIEIPVRSGGEAGVLHIVVGTTDVRTQTDEHEPASSVSHSEQLVKVFGTFSTLVEKSLKRIESRLKAVEDTVKVNIVHDHN